MALRPDNRLGVLQDDSELREWNSIIDEIRACAAQQTGGADVVELLAKVADNFKDEDDLLDDDLLDDEQEQLDCSDDDNGWTDEQADPPMDLDSDDEDDDAVDAPKAQKIGQGDYPVFLTDGQKNAALDLWKALQQGAPDAKLQKLVHSLMLAIFTELVEDPGKRLYTVIEAFMLAINVRTDGTVRRAVSATPDLSKLQYATLYCILKEGVDCKDLPG